MTADEIDVIAKLFSSLADSTQTLSVYIQALWIVMVIAVYIQAFWTFTIARRLRAIEKKDAA